MEGEYHSPHSITSSLAIIKKAYVRHRIRAGASVTSPTPISGLETGRADNTFNRYHITSISLSIFVVIVLPSWGIELKDLVGHYGKTENQYIFRSLSRLYFAYSRLNILIISALNLYYIAIYYSTKPTPNCRNITVYSLSRTIGLVIEPNQQYCIYITAQYNSITQILFK